MNCKAKEILARQALDKAYREVGESFLSFLDMSTGCIINDMHGFARKRLHRMFDAAKDELSYTMERCAADNEEVRETALTALAAMKNRLKLYGFDYDAVTKEMPYRDVFGETWHSARDRQKHEGRVAWVENVEVATSVYYCSILVHLHDECGFGEGRLTVSYRAMRADYNEFVGLYLRCKEQADRQMTKMIEDRQARIEKLGLSLVEFDEMNGVVKEEQDNSGVSTAPIPCVPELDHGQSGTPVPTASFDSAASRGIRKIG